MIYTWIHSVVVIVKKTKGVTTYETAVMISALVGLLLFILGAL